MIHKISVKTGLTALAMTSAIAFSSVSHALSAFSDDFESYTAESDFGPWAVFSDNAGLGAYFFQPASTSGGTNGDAISALGTCPECGNQYLNFFANYGNAAVHGNGTLQEAISIFHEELFTGAEAATGDTWVFSFDYAQNPQAPVTGDTQVGAFIRVLDGANNLLDEQTFDTLAALDSFQAAQLSQDLDPGWIDGGKIQIGFNNLVGNYEGSGRLYDNVNFDVAPIPVPAAVWLFGSGLIGLVGVARRRKAQA